MTTGNPQGVDRRQPGRKMVADCRLYPRDRVNLPSGLLFRGGGFYELQGGAFGGGVDGQSCATVTKTDARALASVPQDNRGLFNDTMD